MIENQKNSGQWVFHDDRIRNKIENLHNNTEIVRIFPHLAGRPFGCTPFRQWAPMEKTVIFWFYTIRIKYYNRAAVRQYAGLSANWTVVYA